LANIDEGVARLAVAIEEVLGDAGHEHSGVPDCDGDAESAGPADMLYVIARSAGQGRPAGIVSALGIAGGCLVHTLAVAFGLASLMVAVPVAYEVVKYAGAAYLVYLGIRTLTTRHRLATNTPISQDSLGAIFLQEVVTNVLNPKAPFSWHSSAVRG
jgi:threonine/homoserine/homoserine lactone efflux protein